MQHIAPPGTTSAHRACVVMIWKQTRMSLFPLYMLGEMLCLALTFWLSVRARYKTPSENPIHGYISYQWCSWAHSLLWILFSVCWAGKLCLAVFVWASRALFLWKFAAFRCFVVLHNAFKFLGESVLPTLCHGLLRMPALTANIWLNVYCRSEKTSSRLCKWTDTLSKVCSQCIAQTSQNVCFVLLLSKMHCTVILYSLK